MFRKYRKELFIHLYIHFWTTDVDVNERYLHRHLFLEELKPTLSKVTSILSDLESDDPKSSILLLRITTPPQSYLTLTQAINLLLSRITRSKGRNGPSMQGLLNTPRQIESKMISARGVEYSKPTTRTMKKSEPSVSIDNPGVEFNQKVLPY